MDKVVVSVCKETSKELENLINNAYLEGERGIFPWDNKENTRLKSNSESIQKYISRGEILVAHVYGQLAGSVRLDTKDQPGMVGQLAVSSEYRKCGVGAKLQEYCQEYAKLNFGMKKLTIEFINPTEFEHEFKTFLHAWYQRLGFVVVKETAVEDHPVYSNLGKILLTPCKFVELEKEI
uniref:N-acetyltransferase domain-containing protein n=1 Tax=Clytia hemisphaerica TaxID=252671 RepID=A0A7M5U7C7_9CNID